MDPIILDHYLDTTQNIALLGNEEDLVAYISEQKNKYCHDPSLIPFFSAEQAFYQKEYKNALKFYLNAREVPLYRFFCFRASAYLSQLMRSNIKALQFAKKALRIKPDDYSTLRLLENLYLLTDQVDKAEIVKKKIYTLKASKEENPQEEEISHFVPVGTEELDELSSIFAESHADDEELFDLENVAKEQPKEEEVKKTPPPFEKKITDSNNAYEASLRQYWDAYKKRPPLKNSFCLFFDGCSGAASTDAFAALAEPPHSGCFITWRGQGIAINPDAHFVQNLHRHGLFIWDVNAVVVTHKEGYALDSLKKLHTLQLHSSKERSLAPLHFFLHEEAYRQFPALIRTDAIHKLDEKAQFIHSLNDEITIQLIPSKNREGSISFALHLRFGTETVRTLCYLAHCSPNAHICQNFNACDIAIANIGKMEAPIKSDEKNQAFHNILAWANELQPKLLLASDFAPEQLNLRLDAIKLLRHTLDHKITLLPSEQGLYLDIEHLQLLSSDKKQTLDPDESRIAASSGGSGPLLFLPAEEVL